MPLRWFQCPDNERIEVSDCLKEGGCRMNDRCATRSYLKFASSDRPWTGKPSTTQLISGTMHSYLKLVNDYAVSPDDRAFMIHGTKGHANLEAADDEYSFLEEGFNDDDTEVTGIADVLEIEKGWTVLADYKTSGSYKIAKALGFYVDKEDTGTFYKSGQKKGLPRTRNVLKRDDSKIDRDDWELQLNKYRVEFEKRGFKVDEIKIQVVCRDGNTQVARGRGVFRNVYYFRVNILPDDYINKYFETKRLALLKALKQGGWDEICTAAENWDSLKCQRYCEVAEHCSYGKYLKQEKEIEDMAIKGLSQIRRLPRLGKIRLGIKKKSAKGKEYPAEVDYFILDPQTPSELENDKLKQEFIKLYGDQPKSIKIMFPVADTEHYFPQDYKRYGSGSSLKCKGDGETASCTMEEFAKDLKVTGKDEMGLTKVKCAGRDCPYYIKKECSEVGILQILLPELPGAGVWQVTTGSFHSIVNLNSCIEYIKTVCGRAHMIPLTLERRPQETSYEGKKAMHYILHINMELRLADIQKFATIEPTRALLELPEPEAGVEDLLFRENAVIEPVAIEDKGKASEPATPGKEDADKKPLEKPKQEERAEPNDKEATKTALRMIERIALFKHQVEANNWNAKHEKEVEALPSKQQKMVIDAFNDKVSRFEGADGMSEAGRDFEKELSNAKSIDESDNVWAEFEATKPKGSEIVPMRHVKDKRVVELRGGKG